MDIGASQITNVIVSSTTSYMVAYSDIFLLMGGLVLALAVSGALLEVFFNRNIPVQERNGTASTEAMLEWDWVKKDKVSRKYYKSKYYPGSKKFWGRYAGDEKE
jgi:hypothetical protein